VTDTGEGIPPEQLPRIWDRYYTVKNYYKRPVAGTGLGLSIVKSILLLHGARFGVHSEVGQGSTFWFALPEVTPEMQDQDK
jgi:signal transduction histidine kinase